MIKYFTKWELSSHKVLCTVEVARTRMREEGDKYRRFWQTLSRVVVESGWRGLYGGLSAQLLRAVPNTALILLTYELTVYTLTPHK